MVVIHPGDPPAPLLSLAAGLALIEAVDAATPGRSTMLKWPNDLLLDGGKLGGILLERNGDRIVAGFGVNLAAAPDLPGRTAASLAGAISPKAFAPLLAASAGRWWSKWRSEPAQALTRAWIARAHPMGAPLAVHVSITETVAGVFDGIEADGALRLRRDDGTVEIVRAGDVEL